MKRIFFVMVAFVLTGLSGCKKVLDYIKDHPDNMVDNCKIDEIYFTEHYIDPLDGDGFILFRDTADFKYNALGQVISIDYASQKNDLGWDVYPIMGKVFKYDSNGRLQGYFTNAEVQGVSISGREAHWYTYINEKSIIDSVGTYTSSGTDINDGWEYGYASFYSRITMDNYGRVIKEEFSDGNTVSYNYDNKGNLIKPGVTYTNKTNTLQTSKALMFVTRNYSVNATTGSATQFNTNGLPVKINAGYLPVITEIYPGLISPFDQQNVTVKYICK
ncbi:MAG: hypothetical protein QM668_09815 [Agriterribacter sp.]